MSTLQNDNFILSQEQSMEACYHSQHFSSNGTYCQCIWDSVLCWPETKAGSVVELACPIMKGSDPTKTVSKYCGINGEWETYNNDRNATNYADCFTEEIFLLYAQIKNMTIQDFELRIETAKMIRILEIVGLTASLAVLCLSFAIYYTFQSLRNDRTRIHSNLFTAVTGFVFIKLLICIDQMVIGYNNILPTYTGLDSTPMVCESAYVILEYCKSCTFMWMFIEAVHLHYAVAIAATKMSFKKYYLILGWIIPVVFVIIWVAMMISKPRSHCWWGYNYNPLFWILEGPRILVLIINTMFLINIVKVVFTKLRSSSNNEVEKIKKTLKATLVLLPLLGITNSLSYVEPQLNCPLWYFTLYTGVSYFLTSFQGMFIGLLYCILNQEVKETVLSKITTNFSSGSNSQPQAGNIERRDDEKLPSIENIIFA